MAWECISAHLLGVELAGLEQHAVGDADLADVVHGAGVADQLGLVLGGAEPVGHAADPLDVLAGVATDGPSETPDSCRPALRKPLTIWPQARPLLAC